MTCQFNHRGTHLAVGDESGRIDLWSFVPLRIYVKSLELTSGLLDKVLTPAPVTDSAKGVLGGGIGARKNEAKEDEREDADHGWSTASVGWSRQVSQRTACLSCFIVNSILNQSNILCDRLRSRGKVSGHSIRGKIYTLLEGSPRNGRHTVAARSLDHVVLNGAAAAYGI